MNLNDNILEIISNQECSASSKKTYTSLVRCFLRKNPQFVSMENQYQEIHDTIMAANKSDNWKKSLFHCMSLGRRDNTDITAVFGPAHAKMQQIINEKRKAGKPAKRAKNNVVITLDDLRAIPINNDKVDQKSLIYNLLVHQDETTRLGLHSLLYDPEDKEGKNYLECAGDICRIVMNDYKTHKTYGAWVINFTGPMKDYIISYLSKTNKQKGSVFFWNKLGNPYSRNKFSSLIGRIMKKRIGTTLKTNQIRKIKANGLFHHHPRKLEMSLKEREEYVIQTFRHSLQTSDMDYYNKIEKEEEKKEEIVEEVVVEEEKKEEEMVENLFYEEQPYVPDEPIVRPVEPIITLELPKGIMSLSSHNMKVLNMLIATFVRENNKA